MWVELMGGGTVYSGTWINKFMHTVLVLKLTAMMMD